MSTHAALGDTSTDYGRREMMARTRQQEIKRRRKRREERQKEARHAAMKAKK